jgi:hypothetical protein
MKTRLIFFVILLAGIAACQQSDMVQTDGALRTTDESGIIPLGGHAHQYPLTSSVRLMTNLVGAANLSDLTAGFGWGGSFPVNAFRVSASNQGVLLWYCFKGGRNPQMFLALEQLKDYDPHNMPKEPASSELLVPSVVFKNNLSGARSESAVREFLRNQTGDQASWITLAASEVKGYIKSADSLFQTVRDGQGERYNNYMFGFFSVRHEAAFNEFLDTAGENGYIRYYFGYDENDRPNRIRIILMAADARGVNASLSRTSDDGSTMQRSWPPPPDN